MIFRKQLHSKDDVKLRVFDVDQILERLSSVSVPQFDSIVPPPSQDETDATTVKKPLDEVLKDLITSNFDLKILDQWDKKKNT